jgi:periplasmic protein TonB
VTSTSTNGLARALSAESRSRKDVGLSLALALIFHGSIALALPKSESLPARQAPMQQTIELEPPLPEPEKPEETPPPDKPAPPDKPDEPPQPSPQLKAPAQAAAPAPVQAAAVLTQKSDEPVDFGDSMVVGNAETSLGGASAANGTGTKPVTRAAANGTGGVGTAATGSPAAPKPAGPNLSRRARLAGGGSWDCAFPEQANAEQVDHAVVTLRINVAEGGSVRSVTVEADPGHGFGGAARSCALRKQFEPALDAEGNPTSGSSLINVRFNR